MHKLDFFLYYNLLNNFKKRNSASLFNVKCPYTNYLYFYLKYQFFYRNIKTLPYNGSSIIIFEKKIKVVFSK